MERLVLDYLDGRWPGAPPESEELPELEKYYFRDATFRRGWICYMEGGRLHSPELQAAHHPLLRRRHLRQLHAGHAAEHHLPSHPRQGGGPSAVLSLRLGVR